MICASPGLGSSGLVQCRKCEACRLRAKRHWLGRFAAQAYTSDAVRFVTLTADDKHLSEIEGLPLDPLKVFRDSLRRAGFTFKHQFVGEYGDLRGRPHYHGLLLFKGWPPEIPLGVSYRHKYWAKGNSQWEVPRSMSGSIAYIFDYLDKGGTKFRPSHGVGKQYLLNWARLMARSRKLLVGKYGIEYSVPNDRMKDGKLWQRHIAGGHHYAPLLAEAYLTEWLSLWGDEPRMSQFNAISFDY